MDGLQKCFSCHLMLCNRQNKAEYSARNNVGQSDNFQTILHISGQFNFFLDIVPEQFRMLESNLTKSMAFHNLTTSMAFHYEVC